MSNGFERHNIDHLSASSINLWNNAPDVWVASYLLKRRTPMGAAPMRGVAAEKAVANILGGMSEADAIKFALDDFDARFMFQDEATQKERALIADMVKVTVEELKPYGVPDFPEDGQHKVSITANCGSFSIPVIGFLDFVFPAHGLVVDLKTTSRVPSMMTADHQLQRAIYSKAMGNMAVKFLYVSAKKAAWLEDGDPAQILSSIKPQIMRMEAFLRHNDAASAQATIPVAPHSFYWKGNEDMRKEIYGL